MSQSVLTVNQVTHAVRNIKAALYDKNFVLTMNYVEEILGWEQRQLGVPPQVLNMAHKVRSKIVPLLRVPPPPNMSSSHFTQLKRQVDQVVADTQVRCPGKSVPVDPRTKSCPPGHERILDDKGQPTNCCAKVNQEVDFMQNEIRRIDHGFGRNTSPDSARNRSEFRQRFRPNNNRVEALKKYYSASKSSHLWNMLQRQKLTEQKELESMSPTQRAVCMGISYKLYKYLASLHKKTQDFIEWYLSVDFTRWWFLLMFVRVVAWFACGFVSFTESSSWIMAFFQSAQLTTVLSTTASTAGTIFLPLCLGYAVVTAFRKFLSVVQPRSFTQVFANPTSAVVYGDKDEASSRNQTVGKSYFYRLSQLVSNSSVGFLTDMMFIMRDMFWGMTTVGTQLWTSGGGINVALRVAAQDYCRRPFKTFATDVGQSVWRYLQSFSAIMYEYVLGPIFTKVSSFISFPAYLKQWLGQDAPAAASGTSWYNYWKAKMPSAPAMPTLESTSTAMNSAYGRVSEAMGGFANAASGAYSMAGNAANTVSSAASGAFSMAGSAANTVSSAASGAYSMAGNAANTVNSAASGAYSAANTLSSVASEAYNMAGSAAHTLSTTSLAWYNTFKGWMPSVFTGAPT